MHDNRAYRRIVHQPCQCFACLRDEDRIEGVQHARPVEGEFTDRVFNAELERAVGHKLDLRWR